MDTNNTGIQITKQGFESLERELDQLVNGKRPRLVERLSHARGEGDLAENSDYQNAKDELEFLDGRIAEIEDVLRRAVVVKGGVKNGRVSFGAKVTLKVNGKEHVYQIVGEWEADPAEKRISNTSPLGQALIGRKVGDKVKVEAPVGRMTYRILSID